MVKQIALAALLVGNGASPSFEQPAQLPQSCLHGPSEQAPQRARREQALKLAQQINRAENRGPAVIPPRSPRNYLPLDQLPNLPPTPAGFKLRLYTDGQSYTFSLKDASDRCEYAIFSDQDAGIYEAVPRAGVSLLPVETK